MHIRPGLGRQPLADAIHQRAQIVLDPPLLLVDLFGVHFAAGLLDRVGGVAGADALVGQCLRQRRLDPGQVADLGVLGHVRVQALEEILVAQVVACVQRRCRVEWVHDRPLFPK